MNKHWHTAIKVTWLLYAILKAYQIILLNELAAEGKEYQRIEDQITAIKDQNEILIVQVAEAGSLLTIKKKALEMGFREPTSKDIIYLYEK